MKRIVKYGLEAATDHTFSYLGKYVLLQVIPVGVVTCLLWSECGLWTALPGIGLHVISLALLFPGALLINRIAMRLARSRTWDLQPWRTWMAAFAAVAIEWGYLLSSGVEPDALELLKHAVGDIGAALIHYAGVLVIASTAAQVAAWSLPPSSSETAGRR